jgi:hypothetical protein
MYSEGQEDRLHLRLLPHLGHPDPQPRPRCLSHTPFQAQTHQPRTSPLTQIAPGPETLGVYLSPHSLIEHFSLSNCSFRLVRLTFDEDSKMDPAIEQILKEEVASCLEAAENYRASDKMEQALSKCEEAYVRTDLCRK